MALICYHLNCFNLKYFFFSAPYAQCLTFNKYLLKELMFGTFSVLDNNETHICVYRAYSSTYLQRHLPNNLETSGYVKLLLDIYNKHRILQHLI